jgi:hypothetical protein
LYEESVGYAVFDNTKVAFGVSGGGGSGVAVDKATGSSCRTWAAVTERGS